MSTMTKYFGNVGHHLAGLIKDPRYNLRESVSGNPNVAICYDGQVGDASIRIEIFGAHPRLSGLPAWASVTVAYGEVRNIWSSQAPLAEHGILYATSEYRAPGETPVGGSALPGYDLVGLKWRVSGTAPRCRTRVASVGDGYHQADDIVAHLLSMREQVETATGSVQDFSYGSWDSAAHRTGFGSPKTCPCCGAKGGDGLPCSDCSDEDGEHGGAL